MLFYFFILLFIYSNYSVLAQLGFSLAWLGWAVTIVIVPVEEQNSGEDCQDQYSVNEDKEIEVTDKSIIEPIDESKLESSKAGPNSDQVRTRNSSKSVMGSVKPTLKA